MKSHRLGVLLAGAFLVFSTPVLAASSQPGTSLSLSQTTPEAKTQIKIDPISSPNSGITGNIPPTPKEVVAAPPVNTTTRVEVHNQAPAANPPANQPANIHITIPEAKVPAPVVNSTDKETFTEHTTIYTDNKANEPVKDNFMYLAIFGILAVVAIIGLIFVLSRRRSFGTPV